MEISSDKLWKLEEHLAKQMRILQYTLDARRLSSKQHSKVSSQLLTCERLHLQVLDKVLPS